MKNRIGETAGRVWRVLAENGELSIARLSKLVGEKEGAVQMAIGWLAREDKVEFHEKSGKMTVGIKD